MASKNICSEGYIQFPVFLSAPVSFSLFAGLALELLCDEGSDGIARGIVDTSRCVASRNDDSILEDCDAVGDWANCEESQEVWTGDCDGAAGGWGVALAFWAFACLSHASRVLWSTGQAAGSS